MTTEITELLTTTGPAFAAVWIITILCIVLRPQRYFNSLLLMGALLVTMIFLSGFFGHDTGAWVLLASFLLVMLALFLVPVLLILNGVQMLRRESFSHHPERRTGRQRNDQRGTGDEDLSAGARRAGAGYRA